MSLIFMQHERHGDHIVYTEDDAIACEKLGWIRKPFPKVKKQRGNPSSRKTESDQVSKESDD